MTVQGVWRREELTYCSNVHPGETGGAVRRVIAHAIAGVRCSRSLPRMGSGLWLSAQAADELQAADARAAFREILMDNGVELFTLNGFPYGNFHSASVKAQIYTPDWTDPKRLAYTQALALILADCLPAWQKEGTISTVPLGYRPGWTAGHQQAALNALCQLAGFLAGLWERTGRRIRVCLEMEPSCVLESTDEMLKLFSDELPSAARRQGMALELLEQHLGVCFDVCHQAVMFEEPQLSLSRLYEVGIRIGKIQLSSALEVVHPDRPEVLAVLREFAEPRYLHQVRTGTEGELSGVMDLPQALEPPGLPAQTPWRVHFHVPVQAAVLEGGELGTTQTAITQVLDFLAGQREVHPHLEVETYTWQVLPSALRPRNETELLDGLAAELAWVEGQMQQRGLLQP
jgi:hypothetical protein